MCVPSGTDSRNLVSLRDDVSCEMDNMLRSGRWLPLKPVANRPLDAREMSSSNTLMRGTLRASTESTTWMWDARPNSLMPPCLPRSSQSSGQCPPYSAFQLPTETRLFNFNFCRFRTIWICYGEPTNSDGMCHSLQPDMCWVTLRFLIVAVLCITICATIGSARALRRFTTVAFRSSQMRHNATIVRGVTSRLKARFDVQ